MYMLHTFDTPEVSVWCLMHGPVISVVVLAEISLRSPRYLFLL